MTASHRPSAHSYDYRRRQQAEKQQSQGLVLPQIQNATAAGDSQETSL